MSDDGETLDFSDPMQRPRFAGIATFFRLPWQEDFEVSPPDIGVIGVPYDGGVTNRPGARHGPREVRSQSSLIRRINQATGASPFEAKRIADLGDVIIAKPYELTGAHSEIQKFYERVVAAGIRPLSCGGDHSVALPILRAVAKDRPVGLIQIDAHADTGDNYMGSRFHHGAPFKVATDEGLLDPKRSVQIGIRGSLYDRDMWKFSHDAGMKVAYIEEVEEKGWKQVMTEALAFAGPGPVYVSVDIDSLDPAFAPGTGTPESGGLTMRELQGMIRMLKGQEIVGADLVEVSPPFDVGGLTAMNAANAMFELLCVMAE
ncbi:agmatinase [Albimonas sp. CAU 1670]|uniref:agmatinase n=1 Tax=Albimonas sp. CAU 1670 TaxID=3032599 RepID=UPI0023DC3EDD|nr:agmatinase [Albimonas sp. CAU 1670]MDF2234523.1 agmatinase [Albimonas sp. CAU 1670]